MPSIRRNVSPEHAGERLDRFLAALPEVGSRAAAARVLPTVRVDGSPRPKSYRLGAGEGVGVGPARPPAGESDLTPPDPPPGEPQAEAMDLRTAWEDEHLLVVDKPAGLVVHPGAGHASGTLVAALEGRVAGGDDPERPGIVHRLDRDTSGLMVVARSQSAWEALADLSRRRGLERTYLALVHGRPRSRTGRIEAPIGRDRDDPTRISLETDTSRDATTHFAGDRLWPEHALLRVRLETGRMHQIRVHRAAIDLPVLGDRVYGVRDERRRRQFLHAARLAFTHPLTAERVDAQSPLPPDLEAHLAVLGAAG